jgi:hypothetical protein
MELAIAVIVLAVGLMLERAPRTTAPVRLPARRRR